MLGFETTVLRSFRDLEALRDAWEELLGSSRSPEIFHSWDWIATWWQVFGGDGREPFVITVRHNGRLVGLAPFLVRALTLGPLRFRRLELLGTGEGEADEVCSDCLDLIVAPGYEDMVARLVCELLVGEERRAWDEARFANVLESSLLSRYLRPMVRDTGREVRDQQGGDRYHVDLRVGDFKAYVGRLSRKRRKRIYYYRRRLEKHGGLRERHPQGPGDLPRFLTEIARLNRLRRSSLGKPSAFESARFCRFHELVAPRLWERGQLDLRLWEMEGRSVAAAYNFLYGRNVYYYQCGFDTEAFGNTSAGLVTLTDIIEWAFANGYARFDFLIGAQGSYKEEYACDTDSTATLTFYNDSPAAHLARSAYQAGRILRHARDRVVRAAGGVAASGDSADTPTPPEDDPDGTAPV